jgi:Replicative DNA helicase
MSEQASFAQFGKAFQERLLQALLVDQKFAEQVIEVLEPSYFDLKYLHYLAERYCKYARTYRVYPSLSLLATIIRDELKIANDVILRDQIIDYLQRIKTEPNIGDLPYVKERSLSFCRKQALKQALLKSVEQMESEKYEQIVETIKKAVDAGTGVSLGHEFFKDYESRFTRLKRDCVPTGMGELDKVLNGGAGKGELHCILGNTGTGKSHFLVMLGVNALQLGLNVLHYTFELSETQVGVRYDSNLCDIDSSLVIDSKTDVLAKYENLKGLGKLYIKQYATNTATVHTLSAHIERLSLKGFIPSIVIVDYADIMRSSRQYDSLRHELKLVYEELRGLAMEKNVVVWTASQGNKEGSDVDVVDLTNMSEAYGKAMICDSVISISRRSHEKASGAGRLYVAKNRSGRDGLLYQLKIDTSRSKFEIIKQASFDDEHKVDETEMKNAIRKKLRELNADKELNVKPLSKDVT